MRVRLVSIVAACAFAAAAPAVASDPVPGPADEARAAQAGRDAGAEQRSRAGGPFRVFATQYDPGTARSVEVAVPDKCAKFAALAMTSALASAGCGPGYALGLDYRVQVTRDTGQTATIPVRDAGPWNTDDNWWEPPTGARPRRMFTDLPLGRPEAQAAFYDRYNTVPDCKTLAGAPSGRPGPADQFGRCVLNPAGIDLSIAAAASLGLSSGQNEWVSVIIAWASALAPAGPVAFSPSSGCGSSVAARVLGSATVVAVSASSRDSTRTVSISKSSGPSWISLGASAGNPATATLTAAPGILDFVLQLVGVVPSVRLVATDDANPPASAACEITLRTTLF